MSPTLISYFDHKNIMKYCNRPFKDVGEMNALMIENLRKAEQAGHRIVHLGDVSFGLKSFIKRYGWLDYPDEHIMVCGNHDPMSDEMATYLEAFGTIIGSPSTWKTHMGFIADELDGKFVRLQISHCPIKKKKVDYALYGHVHNNGLIPDPDYLARNPERKGDDYSFALNDPSYVNCCVELTNYKPMTLRELLDRPPA